MAAGLKAPPHIGKVNVLSSDVQAALALGNNFLVREGLEEDVAMQIFHGHYSVGLDEAIAEILGGPAYLLETEVVTRAEVDDPETVVWHVTSEGHAVPAVWRKGFHVSPELLVAVTRFACFLEAEDLTGVLAIRALESCFDLGPDRAAVEFTDEALRRQWVEIRPRTEVSDRQAAIWRATAAGPLIMRWCTDPGSTGGSGFH